MAVIVRDTFPIDAAILGNTETGQAWEVLSGSWSKVSGQAVPGGAGSLAAVESGIQNKRVSCDITYSTNAEACVLFRVLNASNFYQLGLQNGDVKLYKNITGSAWTLLGSVAQTTANGVTYHIVITDINNQITVSVDGVQKIQVTDAVGATYTKVGMRNGGSNVNSRWDNFEVDDLQTGGQTVTPTGIASTAVIGTPTLTPGSVTLALSGIASTAALGTPTLTVGEAPPQTLSVSGIASTAQLGTPTLTPGAVTVSVSGIASTAALGTPTLSLASGPQTLSLAGIPSTAQVGTITFAPGPVTLTLTGIPSGATMGTPTLSAGAAPQTLSLSGIPSGAQVGTPTLGVSLALTGIPSGASIGVPTFVPGPVTLQLTGIASTAQIGTIYVGGEYKPITITLEAQERTAVLSYQTYSVALEVENLPLIGDTIRLKVTFADFTGAAVDPTDIKLKIYDSGRTLLETITIDASCKVAAGQYQYDYTVPTGVGNLVYEFAGTYGNKPILGRAVLDRGWVA